MVICEVML
jgi:hypothetical protein